MAALRPRGTSGERARARSPSRQQPDVPGNLAPRRDPTARRRFHGLPARSRCSPRCSPSSTAPPRADRRGVREQHPVRVPGSRRRATQANWVAEQLRQFGLRTEVDRFHAKIPGRGASSSKTCSQSAKGARTRSSSSLRTATTPARARARTTTAPGTAALIELARRSRSPRAPPQPPRQHTILFLSTDGGAFGGLGAEHFAEHYAFRERVVATSTSTRSAVEARRTSCSAATRRAFHPRSSCGRRSARILEQTGAEPTRPGALGAAPRPRLPAQPLRAGAVRRSRDRPRVTLTSAGDRPPPSFGDTPENLAGGALTRSGARARRCSVPRREVELAEGTSSYVYLGERVVRGWAIVLILFTRCSCLAVIVDLFARLRRRHIPLAPALRSYRSRLCVLALRVLLFELFALLGVWETGAERPLRRSCRPGRSGRSSASPSTRPPARRRLARRTRPAAPRRPVADAEELAGQVGALLALAVLSLLVVAMNPYSVLFLLPSLHAWIWLPQLRDGPGAPRGRPRRRLRRAAPAPRLARFRLDLGFDAPWYLAQLAAVGFVPFPALLVTGSPGSRSPASWRPRSPDATRRIPPPVSARGSASGRARAQAVLASRAALGHRGAQAALGP